MKNLHRTPNTIKCLTLKLSLAPEVEIADLRGKRYRLTVPLNGLVFDNHSATPAWFYAVFPPQLGSGAVPVPTGVRLANHRVVMSGADSTDPRQAIVSRLVLDLEFDTDAQTFANLPLVVKGISVATNAPASFSLPAFTPSVDPLLTVVDADGGAIAAGFSLELIVPEPIDAHTLEGNPASYFATATSLAALQAKLQNLDWQNSVRDKDASAPPGSPAEGDRYLVAAPATGGWLGHSGEIAEYDGDSWNFTAPNEGLAVWVEDENTHYRHDGSAWAEWESGGAGLLEELGDVSLSAPADGEVLKFNGTTWTNAEGGTGNGTANLQSIEQETHALAVGNWVRHNGTAYVKAQADSAGNSEVLGIVNEVEDADRFSLASDGYVEGLSGLSPGTAYFLSATTAGNMTATEPTTPGQVSRPVFFAVSSTAGYILNYRGYQVPESEEDDGDADTLNDEDGEYYLDRANHTGVQAISTVTGLQTALDGKAASSHTHIISNVTGLQTALDGKAATSHTHIIGNVTGLQTALDGKASTAHRATHITGGADAFLTPDIIEAIVKRIRESGGTTLTLGAVANGEYLYRSGSSIIGGTPESSVNVSVSVKSSGQQAITDSTNTAVTFDQEEWDTDNMHSTSSNTSRLVVPSGQGGHYLVMGQVAFDNNAVGHRNLKIRVNGSSSTWLAKSNQTMLGSTDCQWLQVSKVIALSAGDYVELIAYQTSGTTLNIGIGVDESGIDETSWFQMIKVG